MPEIIKPDYVIKDSGVRQKFNTGAQRDVQEDKGRFDLLPTRALRRVARHFEKGAKKYDARNWEKGMPVSRFLDSALRHAFSYMEGSSDEDHLVAACWNLLCALDTESRIQDGVLPKSLMDIGPYQNVSIKEEDPPPVSQVPGSGSDAA